MSRDRRNSSTSSGRRRSMSDHNRDYDRDDDYRLGRRSSRRDSRSSSTGYSFGDRRNSEYRLSPDRETRTDRAALRTASISHNVTKTAGHSVEHIAARGAGAVDIVRGAVGELWDGIWGDKSGARKNFERVERGKHTVRYGRHAEPAEISVPRNSRGSISRVIADRERDEDRERRRSSAGYRDGYNTGLGSGGQRVTEEAVPPPVQATQ